LIKFGQNLNLTPPTHSISNDYDWNVSYWSLRKRKLSNFKTRYRSTSRVELHYYTAYSGLFFGLNHKHKSYFILSHNNFFLIWIDNFIEYSIVPAGFPTWILPGGTKNLPRPLQRSCSLKKVFDLLKVFDNVKISTLLYVHNNLKSILLENKWHWIKYGAYLSQGSLCLGPDINRMMYPLYPRLGGPEYW